MPTVTTCPSRDQFVALMQGKLPAADAEPLVAHVESCSLCVSALQELRAGDTVVELLGTTLHGEPAQVPAWLESLIAKLGRLPQISLPTATTANVPLASSTSTVKLPGGNTGRSQRPRRPDEVVRCALNQDGIQSKKRPRRSRGLFLVDAGNCRRMDHRQVRHAVPNDG